MVDPGHLTTRISVEFQPLGRRALVAAGTTVLQASREAGTLLLSVCGGAGLCDSCRVRVVAGPVSAPSQHERDELSADELRAGYRLACQAIVNGDLVVEVPVESIGVGQRLQLECDVRLGMDGQPPDTLDRPIGGCDVAVPPADRNDLRADVSRLRDACNERTGARPASIPGPVLRTLSDTLREQAWRARVAFDDERLIALLPSGSRLLGLAVDAGTTKVAAYLLDLESGQALAAEGAVNPQVSYGEDVMSRIAFADTTPGGSDLLHQVFIEGLNAMIARLCRTAGVSSRQIVDVVLVGNTVMHHLACRLPVQALGRAPYVPVVADSLTLDASDLRLEVAPGARVYLPPNVAGYVGADHVAALSAVGPAPEGRTRLVIDIGTNTEISLLAAGRIVSCSCASGPAFEGAHITGGMRAVTGAIERVRIVGDEVRYQTVGEAPAIGICGSGVLDAIAELVAHGALDRHGGFRRDHPLVALRDGQRAVVLATAGLTGHNRELALTRHDVTEVQLAKAAIRTGIDLLLSRAGLAAQAVDEVVVAGAFGSYIDLASARRIGMLPDLPSGRFTQVGNAAGAGARRMLLSARQRRDAERLASRVEYLDLASDSRFGDAFAAALGF